MVSRAFEMKAANIGNSGLKRKGEKGSKFKVYGSRLRAALASDLRIVTSYQEIIPGLSRF
jgi:hypothetical protein